MQFYNIDDDFVSELKKIEPKIQDNYSGRRPYVGIVLSINGVDYFAPLSSYKEKQDNIRNISVFKLHEKGNPSNKLGVIHLNNMFPVPCDKLQKVSIDVTTKYGILLQNQYEYILHCQSHIKEQAKKLHKIIVSDDGHFLKSISCNFKLLEEHIKNKISN